MKKKTVLKNAGVLLIVAVMVLSSVVVSGNVVVTTMDTILSEGFEGGVMPPSGWSLPTGSGSWVITNDAHSGNYAGKTNAGYSALATPTVDLSAGGYALEFWHKQASGNSLGICTSEDGGATWASPIASFTSTITSYTLQVVDLSAYTSAITFVFEANGDSVYIDDVNINNNGENNPPETPLKPSGPVTGEPGVQYMYTTSTTDPDDDRVKYGWDLDGDGIVQPGHWTGLMTSGAPCTVGVTFNSVGTYHIQVMAEDEYGLQSGFSPTLTVVISTGCGYFQGIQMCPLGQAVLHFGDVLTVSNIGDGDDFIDGVYPVGFQGSSSGYTCTLENLFQSPDSAVKVEFTGTYEGESFWMSASIGGGGPCKAAGLGVYPVGFSGTSSGAPSIIAFPPKGDGDIPIGFPVELGCMGYITIGGGPCKAAGLGVYPVGFCGTSSGAPSICWQPDDDDDVIKWTWEEMDIHDLEIGGLMVRWEQPEPGDGSLTAASITAKGMDEFIMTKHHADELDPLAEPTIDGTTSGKAGTEYTYTISNIGTQDVYICIDWGDSSPVEWTSLTSPAASTTASHTWSEEGTYTIKARSMDEWGMMSDWTELIVTMPRNRAINRPFLNFLEQYPILYQLLQRFLRL